MINMSPDLQGLPFSGAPPAVAAYAVLLLAMGLLISWAAPACNNPVFAGASAYTESVLAGVWHWRVVQQIQATCHTPCMPYTSMAHVLFAH